MCFQETFSVIDLKESEMLCCRIKRVSYVNHTIYKDMCVSLKREVLNQNLKWIAEALMWKCETEFLEVNRKAAMI